PPASRRAVQAASAHRDGRVCAPRGQAVRWNEGCAASSETPAGMQRRHAAGEIAVAHLAEPGLCDHPFKRLLIAKAPDALDEILVGRAVARYPFAHARDRGEGVGIVDFLKPRHGNMRKFETEKTPARLQH